MADQIYNPGPEDAPIVYEVPGTHPLTPLACFAVYEGSAASADYRPALILRSQAGHILGVYRTDDVCKAGDDCEASWAPFLRTGGSGGGGGSSVGVGQMWFDVGLFGDSFVTIPGNASTAVPFEHTFSSDSSLFAFDSVSATNDTFICVSTSHLYLISAASEWNLGGFVQEVNLSAAAPTISSGRLVGPISLHKVHPADYFNLIQPFAGSTQGQIDYMLVIPPASSFGVQLTAFQNSGGSKDLRRGAIMATAWALA